MPEIRYREVYDNKGNIIAREPYVVSDEELERERLMNRKDEILKKSKKDWTIDDIKDLIEAIAKLLL